MRRHSSMDKKQRSAARNAFHTSESGVLLCTGVVACPWPQPARVLAPDLAPPGKLSGTHSPRMHHVPTTHPHHAPLRAPSKRSSPQPRSLVSYSGERLRLYGGARAPTERLRAT